MAKDHVHTVVRVTAHSQCGWRNCIVMSNVLVWQLWLGVYTAGPEWTGLDWTGLEWTGMDRTESVLNYTTASRKCLLVYLTL